MTLMADHGFLRDCILLFLAVLLTLAVFAVRAELIGRIDRIERRLGLLRGRKQRAWWRERQRS